MTPKCRQTIAELINYFEYNCTVDTFDTFKDLGGFAWDQVSAYPYVPETILTPQQLLDRDTQPTLSEDFIHQFQEDVWWGYISYYQKLSENFIRDFQDKVQWHNVSFYQQLSESFIMEFQHKIKWSSLLARECLFSKPLFSNIFLLQFSDKIKQLGSEEQKDRLKNIGKHTIDRTYDIIL